MERKNLQNNWSEMRGQIGERWDDLTDEDLDSIDGNRDSLSESFRIVMGIQEI